MELIVNLPDTLASEAKAAGLLTPQAIERILREAVRNQAVNELFETADRMAAANITPMTMQEIQVEVNAVRKARRERAGRSSHQCRGLGAYLEGLATAGARCRARQALDAVHQRRATR